MTKKDDLLARRAAGAIAHGLHSLLHEATKDACEQAGRKCAKGLRVAKKSVTKAKTFFDRLDEALSRVDEA